MRGRGEGKGGGEEGRHRGRAASRKGRGIAGQRRCRRFPPTVVAKSSEFLDPRFGPRDPRSVRAMQAFRLSVCTAPAALPILRLPLTQIWPLTNRCSHRHKKRRAAESPVALFLQFSCSPPARRRPTSIFSPPPLPPFFYRVSRVPIPSLSFPLPAAASSLSSLRSHPSRCLSPPRCAVPRSVPATHPAAPSLPGPPQRPPAMPAGLLPGTKNRRPAQ